MEQDKELQEINAKKLKKLQEDAKKIPLVNLDQSTRCTNCQGVTSEDLLSELKPGANFCPKCVLMAAEAFARSKSFMIEISGNKKRTYAKISEFNAVTNQLENPQIIDVMKMPMISIVGTVDFYKAVPRNNVAVDGGGKNAK